MKTLSVEKMEKIEGGLAAASDCDAGDIFDIGLGVVGVVGLFAFPPSAFWTVPAATAAGVGLGKAIADCID